MIQEFIEGFSGYRRGVNMISRHGLWGYVLIPGLLSLVFAGGIFVAAILFSDDLGHAMSGWWPDGWIGKSYVDKFATTLSFLMVISTAVLLFKYIIMIVAAPFMAPLSEKIESILTGKPAPPFSVKDAIDDILRTVRLSLRNIFREVLIIFLLWILNFIIPVIGSLLFTAGSFLVQAYYAGFGNMDPTLERKRLKVRERVHFVRSHRGLAMGNGSVFILMSLVPILGWFLAPAFGVASATLSTLKRMGR